MANRLYVGNLPYTMDEQRLLEVFQEYGFSPTSTFVVRDRDSGQSKGFGFVEMPSDADAASAISSMNGAKADGRSLRIDQANERPQRSGGGGGGAGGGSGGRGRDRDRHR